MNKFARVVSALVAIFGRKTTVTAAPVKRTITGGYNILLLAAENRRLKRELGAAEAWGNKVADNAIAYAAEKALLEERIAALEAVLDLLTDSEDKLMLANIQLARENASVKKTIDIGYKDIRPEAMDGDVFISTMYQGNLVEDIDGDYSHWDVVPKYGFAKTKTARYHCRGCRRVESFRGHRCGKK
jgi:hypothetical protein